MTDTAAPKMEFKFIAELDLATKMRMMVEAKDLNALAALTKDLIAIIGAYEVAHTFLGEVVKQRERVAEIKKRLESIIVGEMK